MLSQKISKYSDDTYFDLLNHLFEDLLHWTLERPEIIPAVDIEEFKLLFFLFLTSRKKSNTSTYNEYFCLKYSDEIVDLFLHFRSVCSSYGTLFLQGRGCCSNDLLEFILENSFIQEENYENEIYEEENDCEFENYSTSKIKYW